MSTSVVSRPTPSHRVLLVLRRLLNNSHKGKTATLGELLDGASTECPALLALVIALPFLSPISLGPLTIPASIIIILLAYQIAFDASRSPLPGKYLTLPLPTVVLGAMRRQLLKLEVVGRRSRRNQSIATTPRVPSQAGRIIAGILIAYSALLLAIPVPLLPFSNTLPTLGIILTAYGFQNDRWGWMLLGFLFSILSTLYFGLLVFLGMEATLAILKSLLPA